MTVGWADVDTDLRDTGFLDSSGPFIPPGMQWTVGVGEAFKCSSDIHYYLALMREGGELPPSQWVLVREDGHDTKGLSALRCHISISHCTAVRMVCASHAPPGGAAR